MDRILRSLPSLDFLRGFEAAGRRLSFTLAAQELFLTQSALSRQVKALEDALGVALFERRHRALALTVAGAAYHHAVAEILGALAAATERTRDASRVPGLTVSTTVSFASLWLIPRLARFRASHPAVEVFVSADDRVVDLERGEVDIAVRYLADSAAPSGAKYLFGDRFTPVANPRIVRGKASLRQPADLARHVLLHLEDRDGRMPWLDWQTWLTSNGAPTLRPVGSLHFRVYDQVIQAAVGGQGVALGRLPMLADHLRDGRLVAPFARTLESARSYFAITRTSATARPEVLAFLSWIAGEAAVEGGRARADSTPVAAERPAAARPADARPAAARPAAARPAAARPAAARPAAARPAAARARTRSR